MLRLQIQPVSSSTKPNTSGFQSKLGNVLWNECACHIEEKTLLFHLEKQVRKIHFHGYGPVCQNKTSPEIFLIYRAHLVMIVHKISATDTWCNGAKKFPKVWICSSSARHHTRMMAVCIAVAMYSPVHSNRVHGPDADKAVKDLIHVMYTYTHICIGITHFILGMKQS
jgi:hypothetical protein